MDLFLYDRDLHHKNLTKTVTNEFHKNTNDDICDFIWNFCNNSLVFRQIWGF